MGDKMLEFRLHGRGGQGIVIAAAIFAEAVFLDGSFARAFSLFGAERRGAPVTAFIRTGKERLMPRSRVYRPDYVVVFDATLNAADLTAGLEGKAVMLLNSGKPPENIVASLTGQKCAGKIYNIDATAIAWQHNLTIGSFPMVNTIMLGAMAKISGLASLNSLAVSIKKRVTAQIDLNLAAAEEGYHQVKEAGQLVT